MAEQVEQDHGFNPSAHLTDLKGSKYLEVKWRLVWLRQEHPDARIETALHSLSEKAAVFKAHIEIPGAGAATGWGSETPGDFRDFIEKAETKAIGRALAALGYGTQFCDDFVTVDSGRIVDSPVAPAGRPSPPPQQQFNGQARSGGSFDQPATDKQLQFLNSIAQERGVDADAEIRAITQGQRAITRRETSALIDRIKAMPPNDPDALRKAIWMRLRDVYGEVAEGPARQMIQERFGVGSTKDLQVADLQRLYQYVSGPDQDLLTDYPKPDPNPYADISDF